jgi:FkbM family methyltransferase
MFKKAVKKLLNFWGVEIRRIQVTNKHLFVPIRKSMDEVLKHISSLGFYPKAIIDVGAGKGTFPLLNTFPESEYVWIEPLTEFEEDLKKLVHKFNGQYIIAGAGKFNGKSMIHVHSDLYGSSLYKESDGEEVDGKSREIQIIMLDDLVGKYNLGGDVLLKVDVQGTELDVLDGAQKVLQYCELVILEVSFFKFLKYAPEFYDVIDYMKKRGFAVYDIFGGHNRLIDGALAQKDVLFVKENGRFRQTHRWATDEQIKIFHKSRKAP